MWDDEEGWPEIIAFLHDGCGAVLFGVVASVCVAGRWWDGVIWLGPRTKSGNASRHNVDFFSFVFF